MADQLKTRLHGVYSGMLLRARPLKDKNGRVTRKGYQVLFTESQLYQWLISKRGFTPYQCSYCTGWITVLTCVLDHRIPLGRGGDASLDNLDDICAACNSIKGKMLPESFRRLLKFLFDLSGTSQQCATDIRTRLQRADKHAAQVRRFMTKARNPHLQTEEKF